MTLLAALLIFATIPMDAHIVRDGVDMAETNHFYDDNGRHVFDQIIWYDWEVDRHHVAAWRLAKCAAIVPQAKYGKYRSLWMDNDTLRIVEACYARETWTQVDPELLERDFRAKDKRRELQP